MRCACVAIVASIIALGKTLNLRVVAEGVETAGQRQHLRRLGCDLYQGYLMGEPMEADRLFTLLMGDDVEPRRLFIQRNAKDVRFIDA